MIDQIEYRIASRLADHHLYPFAQNLYLDIFRHFSHFPIALKDVHLKAEGTTITFMALVVHHCLEHPMKEFHALFSGTLTKLKETAQPFFPQDITVETCLGCLLYLYHPVDLHTAIRDLDYTELFNEIETYEFDLKKKTLLLNAL